MNSSRLQCSCLRFTCCTYLLYLLAAAVHFCEVDRRILIDKAFFANSYINIIAIYPAKPMIDRCLEPVMDLYGRCVLTKMRDAKARGDGKAGCLS